MNRVAGLFLAVSTMAVLATACGGGTGGDSAEEGPDRSQQDARPRARAGLIQVASGPLDLTETIEPAEESIHAPYMTVNVAKLGTIEKIDTKSGPRYPPRGETFYAIELTTELDTFDVDLSRKFADQVQVGLAPIQVRTKSDELRIDIGDLDTVPTNSEQFGDTYSIIAAGPETSPPVLQIGESESPIVTYDLGTGKSDGVTTKDLELADKHQVKTPVDAGIYGEIDVSHSITFDRARLTPNSVLTQPSKGNDLLIITAKRSFALGEPESPGQFSEPHLVYFPRDSVRVVDPNGKAYKQRVDSGPYRAEPQDDLPDGTNEEVLFAVEVPRTETEFVLEYQPTLAFDHNNTRKFELDSKELELEFPQE